MKAGQRKIRATEGSYLKKIDADSSQLLPDGLGNGNLYRVSEGEEFIVNAYRQISESTYFVTFDAAYGVAKYNSWYLYAPHFELVEHAKPDDYGLGYFRLDHGRTDSYGAQLYVFECGDQKVSCISGAIGSMPCHPSNDYAGSYRPIPEGVYEVGQVVLEPEHSCHPAIGPKWIPVEPLTHIGGRAGILIHYDWNWQRSPGTAGCIAPIVHRHMDVFESLVNQGALKRLVVDYGYKTINSSLLRI